MSNHIRPKSPGPKHDALAAIAALIAKHQSGEGGRDAEQTLEAIERVLSPVAEPLTLEAVQDSLVRMQVLVDGRDFEAAHSEQLMLYELLLAEQAAAGHVLAQLALDAKTIVTRWR